MINPKSIGPITQNVKHIVQKLPPTPKRPPTQSKKGGE